MVKTKQFVHLLRFLSDTESLSLHSDGVLALLMKSTPVLYFLNCSSFTELTIITQYSLSSKSLTRVSSPSLTPEIAANSLIVTANGFIFAASGNQLTILDATILTSISVLSRYSAPDSIKGMAVKSDNSVIFLAANKRGLLALNISDKANPELMASFPISLESAQSAALDVSLSDDETLAFVAASTSVEVFNISVMPSFSLLKRFATSSALAIGVLDSRLVCGGSSGLAVIDKVSLSIIANISLGSVIDIAVNSANSQLAVATSSTISLLSSNFQIVANFSSNSALPFSASTHFFAFQSPRRRLH
jgi:hypothetical protein